MAHFSLIPIDRMIVKDGVGIEIPSDDTWLNDWSDIHAINVNDSSGEVQPVSGDNRTATAEEIKAVKDKWNTMKAEMDKAIADRAEAWQNSWDRVRQERTDLLKDTDWTVMTDSPLSNDKKTEYLTYRSSLRNIPQTYSSNNAKDIIFDKGDVSVSNSKKITKPT